MFADISSNSVQNFLRYEYSSWSEGCMRLIYWRICATISVLLYPKAFMLESRTGKTVFSGGGREVGKLVVGVGVEQSMFQFGSPCGKSTATPFRRVETKRQIWGLLLLPSILHSMQAPLWSNGQGKCYFKNWNSPEPWNTPRMFKESYFYPLKVRLIFNLLKTSNILHR